MNIVLPLAAVEASARRLREAARERVRVLLSPLLL
jgi:hypothetical protein